MDNSEDLRVSSSPFKSSLWRVFCAIEIPEDVRMRLGDHIRQLREAVPNAKASWSRATSIHLTLKFFGNIENESTGKISAAAAEVAQGASPFSISIAGNGVFPKHGAPRVLWIGIRDPSGNLTELQQRFEAECVRRGFAKEEHAFRPHLTLARLRNPQDARALAEIHKEMSFEVRAADVSELLLIRSELRSEGSKYTVISRHEL